MTDEAKTHDFTKRDWGHDAFVTHSVNAGRQIKLCGWGGDDRLPIEGDFIILQERGGPGVRYRITRVAPMTDPPDQWFADALFDPTTPTP